MLQTALHIAAQRLDGVAQQLRSAAGMSLYLFARLALVAGARQQHLAPRRFPLPPLKLLPVQTLFLLQCHQRLVQRLLRRIRLQDAGIQPQSRVALPNGHGVKIERRARPAGIVAAALLAEGQELLHMDKVRHEILCTCFHRHFADMVLERHLRHLLGSVPTV